jgi:hypothetical protein
MTLNNNQQCIPTPEKSEEGELSVNSIYQTQRCQNRMSPSEFQSQFVMILAPVPVAVQNLCVNALTTSGSVWERHSPITPTIIAQLHPWEQVPMVKKPRTPSTPTPTKEMKQVRPSLTIVNQLKEIKEEYRMMDWNEGSIRKGMEELSLDIKRHSKLLETIAKKHLHSRQPQSPKKTMFKPSQEINNSAEAFLKTIPMLYQSQTQQPCQSQNPLTISKQE